jgi:hypothetical protein
MNEQVGAFFPNLLVAIIIVFLDYSLSAFTHDSSS